MARIGYFFARRGEQATGLTSQAKAAAWARLHATRDNPARIYRFFPGTNTVALCGETCIDPDQTPTPQPCRVSWFQPVPCVGVPVPSPPPRKAPRRPRYLP